MNLSYHFTLAELTKTEIRKYDNTPPNAILPNLKRMAEALEAVRTLLGGKPIIINSCYRSKEVNKAVGSKETSKHREGLAADFICPSYGNPLQICERIIKSNLIWGKLILEFYNPTTGSGWIHYQLGSEKKVFTINSHGTFSGLHP